MVALLGGVLVWGCKREKKEAVQTDALTALIVNGQWGVTRYTKGTLDLTADFAVYRFQFRDNGTVDAIRNNTVEKTGTWVGNLASRTIQAGFSNAPATLLLLNGTWYVTDSGLSYVESSQTVDNEQRTLRLDKK